MTHRERVLKALRHEESDRVPMDFGGTVDSTILVRPYKALRAHLGLDAGTTRVSDAVAQTALVEEDVRAALGADTMGVFYEPIEWRPWNLSDGSPILLPDRFRPRMRYDGSQVVLDSAGNVLLKMPEGGHYFDLIHVPLADAADAHDIDRCMDALETYDRPSFLDTSYEALAKRAKYLYENTDYLLVGFFGGHIFQASQALRGWERFLMDLLADRKFAEALMDRLTEAHIRRFRRYADTIGKYVQVIHVEDDLGMEDRPLLSPALYREAVRPYHARLYNYIKSHCDAYLMLHTDGAVRPLIPDFIEMGVDILNPVQVSAAGMDPQQLKREFGDDIVFWGGGCDTQAVLPFGTPEDVREEVKRRIDHLAPGGGFVFTQIHNVQPHVPPENVVAMFEAAREYGRY
jgi:uroporphyrinogen decarboxylase